MNTFDSILDALLEEYNKNPQCDINEVVKDFAEKQGLRCNAEAVEEVNMVLDKMNEHYNDLLKKKEEEGISTSAWVSKKISDILEESDIDDATKEQFVENIAQVMKEEK